MTSNDTNTVPMCVICFDRTVTIVVNSTGAGYCSPECQASYCEEEDMEFMYPHDLDGYECPEFDG